MEGLNKIGNCSIARVIYIRFRSNKNFANFFSYLNIAKVPFFTIVIEIILIQTTQILEMFANSI